MTEPRGPLPRWGGITEPVTVLTNVVLAGLAFVLGARLAYGAAAVGTASSGALAFGFLSTFVASLLGAASHGIDPRVDPEQRSRCWRGSLYASGFVGASCIASVAFFATRGTTRTAILLFAGVKLVAYLIRLARRPEFRVAAADYGGGLAVLLAGAAYAWARWDVGGAGWIVGGALVSLVAGLVQARRVTLHPHFNYNDLFHVIQMLALYFVYRGGALLVDR